MTPYTTLILSASEVERIIREVGLHPLMDELNVRMEKTFLEYDPAKTIVPVRSGFNYTKPEVGLVEWMPLYQTGELVLIKVVGYHPNNPNKYGVPTIVSTISNYDTATGHLKSLIDGILPTALRTGSASAVASKYLAHPESKILGLIGCGAQAVTQLHALSRVFAFEEVLYYDIDPDTTESFPGRVAALELQINMRSVAIGEIVRQADILCTATSIGVGEGPLFDHLPTKEHLHINAVGADFPGKTELPLSLLHECYVCPDFHQ
ncbi:MAG: ornithine cyclodeaminase family protein, partial [Bacteroidota bacterium]